jgi:hypothetical protein
MAGKVYFFTAALCPDYDLQALRALDRDRTSQAILHHITVQQETVCDSTIAHLSWVLCFPGAFVLGA